MQFQSTKKLERIRKLLLVGAFGAVVVGLYARSAGWIDTSNTRYNARVGISKAIKALLAGRYEDARSLIDQAVAVDRTFGEAQISRAMAYLALGDHSEAKQGANLAMRLLTEHGVDPMSWPNEDPAVAKKRALLMAARIRCVAIAAGNASLSRSESGRLFQCIYEISQEKDCSAINDVYKRWKPEGKPYRVAMLAMSNCTDLWPCHPQKVETLP